MRRRASRMRLNGMVLLSNKMMVHLLLIFRRSSNPPLLADFGEDDGPFFFAWSLEARVASLAK